MIAALLLLALQQPPQAAETIEVRRTIIDARVHDDDYELIDDLEAKDFQVLVDGKEAPIESVTWVSELPTEEAIFDDTGNELSHETVQAPGRLFIVFVQTDFTREHDRVIGEMGVLQSFHALLQTLQPADRVALFSFDSHLKFRLDFTTDHALLEKVFPTVLAIDQPLPPQPAEPPSLSSLLTPRELADAGSSESALILLARKLRRIDGAKTMLLLGWGMGDVIGQRPIITAQVLRSAAELASARVTVHAFNFGIGHQMSAGLAEVAFDTGGFYVAGPAAGPFSAMENSYLPRLESMLQGHYEIEIRSPVPVNLRKVHRLDVRVRQGGYTVIAKNSFVDVP
ncbi:MAG TPA: hypothetical protein VJ901_11435 [Thermoanaerobaculia bacterium]|nr:hypothetical protein [Thermoanaerobaculia bacterium]